MKYLVLSFLFIFQASAQSCYEKLLNGNYNSSAHFIYGEAAIPNFDGEINEQSTEIFLRFLIKEQLNCNDHLSINTIRCSENLKYPVCELETNFGYFHISQAMLDTVNIIYNRWD